MITIIMKLSFGFYAILALLTTALAQPTNSQQQFAPPPPLVPPVSPTQRVSPAITPPIGVPIRPAQQTPPQAIGPLPDNVLAWDSISKEFVARAGEAEGHFAFNFTNVSPDIVTVNAAPGSCGCTVAKLPPLPWKVAPGETGQIPVIMNLAGKSGALVKTVTLMTDKGNKMLMVKSIIESPQPVTPPARGGQQSVTMGADRSKNQDIAKADRQAVFKGDCARCHVEPAKGKMGRELYAAACGVCHEAEHRATMVTDLHNLKTPPTAEYWKFFTANGKPGTLMPAFSQAQGGPLTDAQIASLVDYLVNDFPKTPASHASAPSAPVK